MLLLLLLLLLHVLRRVQHGADVAEGEGRGLLPPLPLPVLAAPLREVGLLGPGFHRAVAWKGTRAATRGGAGRGGKRGLGAQREHVIVLALEALERAIVASLGPVVASGSRVVTSVWRRRSVVKRSLRTIVSSRRFRRVVVAPRTPRAAVRRRWLRRRK